MRVFITGATGWVGSAITKELVQAGHQVLGLVRSEDKARALAALGGEPLLGSLRDIDILETGAEKADAVIHTAFGVGLGEPAVFAQSAKEDRQAIEAFGNVFPGVRPPDFLVTGGIGVLERLSGEASPRKPHPASNQSRIPACASGANCPRLDRARLARHHCARLPRSVHGAGETHGFVPRLMALARKKGVSGYVGDGQNLWPSVHKLDAARVYYLALECGALGGPFHAVADEGIPFKEIAAAIGRRLNLPIKSISADNAAEHFGVMAMPVGGNGPASNARTKERLGWTPRELDLIADIDQNYS